MCLYISQVSLKTLAAAFFSWNRVEKNISLAFKMRCYLDIVFYPELTVLLFFLECIDINTTSFISNKMLDITLWKQAGAPLSPKGIQRNSNCTMNYQSRYSKLKNNSSYVYG